MSRLQKRRAKKRAKVKRRIKIALAICASIIIPIIILSVTGFIAIGTIISNLPTLHDEGDTQNWQTTKIFASDGTLLTNLYYEQDRIVVPLAEISPYLKKAVIAIEDERFYEHKGYDPEAIGRAFFANLKSGRMSEGASTITQQYIKNTIISREKTYDRKIKEAALASQLEKKYTKDQILEKYLNTIYYGHSWYGVETASLNFFGKRSKDLTLPEAAVIAGVIKGPSIYSPYLHPQKSKERRDLVLGRMLKQKRITEAEYKLALATPIKVKPMRKATSLAPYFVEYVKQELIKKYGENVVFKGGLRIYTTIDLKMQKQAEEAAWNTLNRPGDPSAALVAMDPKTGFIRAMVGGKDFEKSKVNLALSHERQPGSSFKTFVFATAIENGMTPYKKFDSSPANIRLSPTDVWNVNNYTEGSGGPPMTIRDALVRSVNTVFARLIMEVTPQKVADLAMRMGISVPITPNPAIALGGFSHGPSVLDMATGYSTIANAGRYNPPVAIVSITDSSHNVIEKYEPKPKRVISEATAYITTDVLEDVILHGTGGKARLSRPAAGKTGTAQLYHDAWFCGFTPDLTAAVWVGYPSSYKSMTNVHGVKVAGGTFPAMIWGKFMSNALKGKKPTPFAKPKGDIVDIRICTQTGLLANEYCPDVEYKPFPKKKVPKKVCKLHAEPAIANVPEVIGYRQSDAMKALDKMHFKPKLVYIKNETVPKGFVVDQKPSPYSRQRQGTVVEIIISGGASGEAVKVPSLVGLTKTQAASFVGQSGLKIVDVTASPFIPNPDKIGRIIYQSPVAGSDMQPGQVVTVYINRKE